MAQLAGISTITYTDLYTSFTEVPGPLMIGDLQPGPSGKWFRLALVGASNLVAGNLLQEAAEDTQFENMACTASAIATSGLQTVNITNGTTTVVAAQYSGGTITVYTTPDFGREYTILSVAGTLTTGGALVVTIDRPLGTAWSTATKVNMKPSPWAGVIQAPASGSNTGAPAGFAVFANTAATYAFVQTHGPGWGLSDASTFAVGSALSNSAATAGAVGVAVTGTTRYQVGIARQAAASAHGISMNIQID